MKQNLKLLTAIIRMTVEMIRLIMLLKIYIIYELNLKEDKNTAQVVTKLSMNPMYGKTIIKPIETDTVVKDSQ